MNILLIGGGGYIGNVVSEFFLKKNYDITIIDNFIYKHNPSIAKIKKFSKLKILEESIIQIDLFEKNLKNYDAVVLLAGLVGDPITKKYPEYSNEINFKGVQNLIDVILKNQVKKFIFISTCSNYGLIKDNELATENFKLDPKSLYAKQKVEAEKYIMKFKKRTDSIVSILRFATAFGVSERMRFDLTVNEFVMNLHLGKRLLVYDPDTWRPYCHVVDFARLIEIVLNSTNSLVNFEIFNAGGDFNNCTKRMLVDKINNHYESSKIEFQQKGPDPRNYRVDFSKVKNRLNFIPKYSIDDGILEIKDYLNSNTFKNQNQSLDMMGNYTIDSIILKNIS
jgi:nucleoside-diphosphate-sugar epimerase